MIVAKIWYSARPKKVVLRKIYYFFSILNIFKLKML